MSTQRRWAEIKALYKFKSGDQELAVRSMLATMQGVKDRLESILGEPLKGKHMLEIGPGQGIHQARFFAIDNHVVAIDLDLVVTDSLGAWIRLWRRNGVVRFGKTLGRKLLGVDRRFERAYFNALPQASRSKVTFHQADATKTMFADSSFDVTLSVSVLEHIPDAENVFKEMVRLTKPNGVFFHVVHVYSSDSGAHAPSTFVADHPGFPYWAHLRQTTNEKPLGNCYVNELSISTWLDIANQYLPGCKVDRNFEARESPLRGELVKLRLAGELPNYSDDDLLTNCLVIAWTKPSDH